MLSFFQEACLSAECICMSCPVSKIISLLITWTQAWCCTCILPPSALSCKKNSGRKIVAIILFEQLMQKWKRSWNLLKASVLMKSTVLYTVPGSSSLFGVAVLQRFGVKSHERQTFTWGISIVYSLSQFVFTQEKDLNVQDIPDICHESHENSCVNFFWPV